jgi:hypothetical protein
VQAQFLSHLLVVYLSSALLMHSLTVLNTSVFLRVLFPDTLMFTFIVTKCSSWVGKHPYNIYFSALILNYFSKYQSVLLVSDSLIQIWIQMFYRELINRRERISSPENYWRNCDGSKLKICSKEKFYFVVLILLFF